MRSGETFSAANRMPARFRIVIDPNVWISAYPANGDTHYMWFGAVPRRDHPIGRT